jgi:hypothetical protein
MSNFQAKKIRTKIDLIFCRFQIVFLRGGPHWVDIMNDKINSQCLHQSTEIRGHLFKAQGGTEGPYGPGSYYFFPESFFRK